MDAMTRAFFELRADRARNPTGPDEKALDLFFPASRLKQRKTSRLSPS